MRWMRSEPMEYISLVVSEDVAHTTVSELGQLGVVEFTDLNHELTPFQRRYINYIRRCDEMERKLRYFEAEISKFGIDVKSLISVEDFIRPQAKDEQSAMQRLQTLETTFEEKENELLELNNFHENLTKEYNEKVEMQEVIKKSHGFFSDQNEDDAGSALDNARRLSRGSIGSAQDGHVPLLALGPDGTYGESNRSYDMRFSHITGVVAREDRLRFERQLFRATRGNCFVRFTAIEEPLTDPATGDEVFKLAFIIFYKSSSIEAKLHKICDSFNARRYTVPALNDMDQVRSLLADGAAALDDSSRVLRKNREACLQLCRRLARELQQWRWTVMQEKAVYHTLNMFKVDVGGMLRAEGWVVSAAMNDVRRAVRAAGEGQGNGGEAIPSLLNLARKPWPAPPTHFITNKFTQVFQDFVDTYGVPRYREINPAVFTAATFPFLFGVMYGDVGHGVVLLLMGLYLVATESRMKNGEPLGELMAGLYSGRYMITMMGVCAVYCGLVYNDLFALGMNLFGSNYEWEEGAEKGAKATTVNGKPGDEEYVYPFGVDPAWHVAENELLFFNSMKMKMSVVLGIIQMLGGQCLKAINALHFGEELDLWFEFVPQFVFSLCLFGYMVVLIFYKWSVDWTVRMLAATCTDEEGCMKADGTHVDVGMPIDCPEEYAGCQPPNLITTLIDIALKPGTVAEPMYHGQSGFQVFLILMAFLSVPLMLVVKPMILKRRAEAQALIPTFHAVDDDEEGHGAAASGGGHGHGGHGGEFNFGEVFIHQAIETIEFVLGMVSNTASYLRLWALSLAHTELATVFWEKAMLVAIQTNNPVFVFVGYAVYAGVTIGVLLMMDVLECFLHALRLHWVEFQNKFYKADGFKFKPFDFKVLLAVQE